MLNWLNHPDDGQLLRYCDGELKSRAASRIERHIHGCQECRAQIEEVRSTMGEYARYRQIVQLAMPAAPKPWMDLEREMGLVREQKGPRFGLNPMSRGLAWAFAACALAAGAGVFYFTRPIPHVLPPDRAPVESVPSAPVPPPRATVPATRPSVQSEAPAAASPDDELKVIAAIHDIGADLGAPVTDERGAAR